MADWTRIFRLSYSLKGYDATHLEMVRAAIAKSVEALKNSHQGDTFAGRKTQEPFPKEEEK